MSLGDHLEGISPSCCGGIRNTFPHILCQVRASSPSRTLTVIHLRCGEREETKIEGGEGDVGRAIEPQPEKVTDFVEPRWTLCHILVSDMTIARKGNWSRQAKGFDVHHALHETVIPLISFLLVTINLTWRVPHHARRSSRTP